jgi:hypothetical protein
MRAFFVEAAIGVTPWKKSRRAAETAEELLPGSCLCTANSQSLRAVRGFLIGHKKHKNSQNFFCGFLRFLRPTD